MEIFKKTLRNFYPIHFNNYRLEDFRAIKNQFRQSSFSFVHYLLDEMLKMKPTDFKSYWD